MHRTARLTISLSDSLIYVVLYLLNTFSEVKAPLITAVMAYYLQLGLIITVNFFIGIIIQP